jgi:hypothetical protein
MLPRALNWLMAVYSVSATVKVQMNQGLAVVLPTPYFQCISIVARPYLAEQGAYIVDIRTISSKRDSRGIRSRIDRIKRRHDIHELLQRH